VKQDDILYLERLMLHLLRERDVTSRSLLDLYYKRVIECAVRNHYP